MSYHRLVTLSLVFLLGLLGGTTSNAATIQVNADNTSNSPDVVRDTSPFDGVGNLAYGNPGTYTGAERAVGKFSSGEDDLLVFSFLLPSLPINEVVSGASFSAYYVSKMGNPGSSPAFNVALSGLNRTNGTPGAITADYGGAGTLFTSTFVDNSTATGQYITFSGAALDNWLNSQYANVGAGNYVFLRLSRSDGGSFAVGDATAGRGYQFIMARGPLSPINTNPNVPFLTINTAAVVPEPSALALLALGGLAWSLSIRRRGHSQ